MIEILNFIFTDFWHFAGCVVLLSIAVSPLIVLAGAMERKQKNYYVTKEVKSEQK